MNTNMLVARTPRSLLRAAPRLVLACAISIPALSRPVLAVSQEREAHLQKAIDELLGGRPLPAVTEASLAVESSPQSAEALAILGLSQLKCGEWEKADSRFNEAVAIDSLSAEAHLGLGVIAISRMHYRDAIPHLRQATSSQLFPGASYRALASSLEDLGLHQEASQAMREASKYSDDINADQLANVRAFADIFAAHDGRSLYRIPADFRSTTVPWRYSQGHVTLPVTLNGSSRIDFALDTGHNGSLLFDDDYAAKLNLTYLGEVRTRSLYGDLLLKAAVLDSIRIGGLLMLEVPVFVCVDCPLGSGGLIGWKIIQRVNTTIDFEESQVRFSSQNTSGLHDEGVVDKERAECVPFVYLTSMYVIARFGDDLPRAFVFDTGCPGSCLHAGGGSVPGDMSADSSPSIRIGDLTFDLPQTQFLDFSGIHRTGRYYFPGVIGIDILRHGVLHILPAESLLCIERGKP
jgi:tetratricopeptide (TPR) repeat protein